MNDCIFCKIAAGEIPTNKIYEDDLVFAFLDIAPINFGHALVIPKEHHQSAASIQEATLGRMFKIASKIGILLKRREEYDGYNLHLADGTVAGQVVMHAHCHVIPRGAEDGFRWNWRQLTYADGAAAAMAAELAQKLTEKLAEKGDK